MVRVKSTGVGTQAAVSAEETGADRRAPGNLTALLSDYRPGYSLPGAFYNAPEVFDAEYDAFLSSHWIAAGHISQIPQKGDYFRFEVAGNALIIVRGADGAVRALHNVCRHRGAQLCEAAQGSVKRIVCRYHAWSYHLDGSLAQWRHMPDELEKTAFALKSCAVRIFEGAIFISLDGDRAPDFDRISAHIGSHWERFDLAGCEIAREETYVVDANWKLGVENNLECYHCMPSHPEFTSVNAFVRSDEQVSVAAVSAFDAYKNEWLGKRERAGAPVGGTGIATIDGQVCRAGSNPLSADFETGSKDGQPLAPLLGRLTGYDESITSGCIGFHSYMAAMSDYALMITYVPQTATLTHVLGKWLVKAGAKANVDYDPADLVWLWDETTKQDKDLIELNARGVTARGYQPGPYSNLESMTADFIERYVALIAARPNQ